MYPGFWSTRSPDKAAAIAASNGRTVTHRELDERSNQLAQLFRDRGLQTGDHVAVFMENSLEIFDVLWAALRSGLYLTTVNRYSTADEAAYVVDNCDARAMVTSARLAEVAAGIPHRAPRCGVRLMVGGSAAGYEDYEAALGGYPAEPIPDESRGEFMFYSSGTTGRPKGIMRPLSGLPISVGLPLNEMFRNQWLVDETAVYLSPAPLYHSAPLASSASVQSLGGTVIMMDAFDAREALALIERHQVTFSQWVPTMFVRMLKLPTEVRMAFDLSSQRVALHGAAPCPQQVKREMLAWWGPIIHEYYGGTELNGTTYASPDDWLSHPGTVGRPILGTLHICDEEGNDRAIGEDGLVYFERDALPFEYYKDQKQTRGAQHPRFPTWTTLGDIGHIDADGYLYLTDRATFMIVSGGVNIYPQEIEDCLIMHPKVADVAVFGVPDDDFGEAVKAVVQPADGEVGTDDLERELMAFAREQLSRYKCPRSIEFTSELPRQPTGKLYKRLLRDRYWLGRDTRIHH
jgi:long-chain acyl-CoA synthetase